MSTLAHNLPNVPGASSFKFPCLFSRELVDDKIAVKEVPKDLRKLATKVLETDVKKAADKLNADVSKAAESVSKESEKTIDAAKDTIDLVRSLYCQCCSCCRNGSV
jgi:hypothetical protein